MTPSPEKIGQGIIDLDAERQEKAIEFEINTIIKNAFDGIETKNRKLFFGLIAEYEELPSGTRKDYFHPVVTVHDEMIDDLDEGGYDDLALGGRDFKSLFSYEHESKTVDWQGSVGVKVYEAINPTETSFPLENFFLHEGNNVFLDFTSVPVKLSSNITAEPDDVHKGEIAKVLLPKTMDAGKKLYFAKRILAGLKNASS